MPGLLVIQIQIQAMRYLFFYTTAIFSVSQKTFLGHKTEGNTAVLCSQKLWYTGAGLGYIYLHIKTCAYFLGEDISVTPNFCTAKVK